MLILRHATFEPLSDLPWAARDCRCDLSQRQIGRMLLHRHIRIARRIGPNDLFARGWPYVHGPMPDVAERADVARS